MTPIDAMKGFSGMVQSWAVGMAAITLIYFLTVVAWKSQGTERQAMRSRVGVLHVLIVIAMVIWTYYFFFHR